MHAHVFHQLLNSDGHVSNDDEGHDFPGLEEAEAAARVSAREIVSGNIKSASQRPLEAVIIIDEHGDELKRISAKEVLPGPLK